MRNGTRDTVRLSQVVLLHVVPERPKAHAEPLGRAWPHRPLQRLGDVAHLVPTCASGSKPDSGRFRAVRRSARRTARDTGRQAVREDGRRRLPGNRPARGIFRLSDVAGPIVLHRSAIASCGCRYIALHHSVYFAGSARRAGRVSRRSLAAANRDDVDDRRDLHGNRRNRSGPDWWPVTRMSACPLEPASPPESPLWSTQRLPA